MKRLNKIYTVLIFMFLYLPMLVLIVASFNTGKDITDFEGFTFRQYSALFRDRTLLTLLWHSLEVAVLSSLIATV
ncbi:MAG: ABC transporter permease, partial [Firmicutes bacterium]|nr:ABC transporter permease [Bacillota bacterium]